MSVRKLYSSLVLVVVHITIIGAIEEYAQGLPSKGFGNSEHLNFSIVPHKSSRENNHFLSKDGSDKVFFEEIIDPSVHPPETHLKPINLSNNKLSVKEKIIDAVKEDIQSGNWNTSKPKLLLLTFRTVKSKVSPEELKKIAEGLYEDLSELEADASINPASFDFGQKQDVILKIKEIIFSAQSSNIYNLDVRFPEVDKHMTNITLPTDLGLLPSKVMQILGYKLFTAKRVENGKIVSLNLPFKIKNMEKEKNYDVVRPLLVEIVKKIDKVQYSNYNVKDLEPGWKLLTITVKIPYSRNRAVFGLDAAEEEEAYITEKQSWLSRRFG